MKFIKFKSKNLPIYNFFIAIFILGSTWLILNLTAPKIPILGFHGIIDIQAPGTQGIVTQSFLDMDYKKQDLEQLLDYLLSRNYWFLSTQELYDYFIAKSKLIPDKYLNKKPIMLSFDDTYKTVYNNLIPVLEKLEAKYNRKAKVVLFVNPGTLDKQERANSLHMSCQDLREGIQKGFYDVQSHGKTHKKLTNLKAQELNEELLDAQVQLRKCTEGLDPNTLVASHIAYPYGAVNRRVEASASHYYLSGYLYNNRNYKWGWLKSNYRIPRLCVNLKKTPSQLIRMAEKAHQLTEKDLKISR